MKEGNFHPENIGLGLHFITCRLLSKPLSPHLSNQDALTYPTGIVTMSQDNVCPSPGKHDDGIHLATDKGAHGLRPGKEQV